MNDQVQNWFKLLESRPIVHAIGDLAPPPDPVPHGGAVEFYFDSDDHCGFSGAAADIGIKDEAFYLQISQWDALSWWNAEKDKPARIFTPVDFVAAWATAGLNDMLSGPRKLNFYCRQSDLDRGFDPNGHGNLEGAAGILLTSTATPQQRILICSSIDYPTHITIFHESSIIDKVMDDFRELSLPWKHRQGDTPGKPGKAGKQGTGAPG